MLDELTELTHVSKTNSRRKTSVCRVFPSLIRGTGRRATQANQQTDSGCRASVAHPDTLGEAGKTRVAQDGDGINANWDASQWSLLRCCIVGFLPPEDAYGRQYERHYSESFEVFFFLFRGLLKRSTIRERGERERALQ